MGRWFWEFDCNWFGTHAIIEGWAVGGCNAVDVSDFEVGVVKTPSSKGPISLPVGGVFSVKVHDNVVDLFFAGIEGFLLEPC